MREPKLLGLVGDAYSGLAEAASLAQEELERLGRECLRLSDLDVRLPTLKYRLLRLLDELMIQRQPGVVRPSLLLASAALNVIRANLSNELSSLEHPIGLIFDRLGSLECLRPNEMFELQELARVSNTPVIFTGDSECPWQSIAQRASIVQLEQFNRDEVRACLLAAPSLAAWKNSQIDQALDKIFGGSETVSPLEVFAQLKVLAA